MPNLDDPGAGIEAARVAIVALAEGREVDALDALNRCTHAEVTWAASYLLSCLKELVSVQVNHNPLRLERALKAGASASAEDAVITTVGVIAQQEHRRI